MGPQPPVPAPSGFSGLSKLTAQIRVFREDQDLPLLSPPPLRSPPPPPSATLSTFSQAENCIFDQLSTLNATPPPRPKTAVDQEKFTRPTAPAFHFPLRPHAPNTTTATLAPNSPTSHLRSKSVDTHFHRHPSTRHPGSGSSANASVDLDWWGSDSSSGLKSRPTWKAPAPVLPPPPPIEVQIQMKIQAQAQAQMQKGHRRQGSAVGRIRRLVAMA
jgi:hypothetical protein